MTPRIRRTAALASCVLAVVLLVGHSAGAHPADPFVGLAPADLAEALGDRAAGTYLESGDRLAVNVLDAGAADAVRAAGADPHLVDNGAARLALLLGAVDTMARSRAPVGTAWYTDVPGNAVVVRVPAGDPAAAAFVRAVRAAAPEARIEQVPGQLTTLGLYGGQPVARPGSTCSLGFNAVDRAGRSAFLTAGHCGVGYPTFSHAGVALGRTVAYRFPGADYAAVALADPVRWGPQAAADRYDGRAVPVRGTRPAPVGATVCKSGLASHWTCGQIVAYGVTVRYAQGVVSGLVRATACSEPGDSGGPWLAGDQAQGITSGGASVNGRCLSRYGRQNEAYYQPVAPALAALGLRLRTAH